MSRLGKPVKAPGGCNQRNPDFRKLHRTNGPVSSTNKLKRKEKKRSTGGEHLLMNRVAGVCGPDSNK